MATASSPWRTVFWMNSFQSDGSLQFGHGIIAVENSPRIPSARRRYGRFNLATASSPWRTRQTLKLLRTETRFNLATASSPWRTLTARLKRLVDVRLQFGHGIIAVENVVLPAVALGVGVASIWPRHHRRGEPGRVAGSDCERGASIWPRHHRRGEPPGSGRCHHPPDCFNLATASSPWRTRIVEAVKHILDELQFGHGIIAVENTW